MAHVALTPIGSNVRLRTRRSLDERFFVRWPGAWAAFGRVIFRLPPRSRLRRALLRRSVLSGWAAWSRGDLDLVLVHHAPDCQFESPPEFVAAGMRSLYEGHAGHRERAADVSDAFEQVDLMPREIVDAGDRLVVLGDWHTRARGSGVELDSHIGIAYWAEHGLIVRDRTFLDWDAALRAADIPITAAGSDRAPGVTAEPSPGI